MKENQVVFQADGSNEAVNGLSNRLAPFSTFSVDMGGFENLRQDQLCNANGIIYEGWVNRMVSWTKSSSSSMLVRIITVDHPLLFRKPDHRADGIGISWAPWDAGCTSRVCWASARHSAWSAPARSTSGKALP